MKRFIFIFFFIIQFVSASESCVQKTGKKIFRQIDNTGWDDKIKHCVFSCQVQTICGNSFALSASIWLKELYDIFGSRDGFDLKDIKASFIGISIARENNPSGENFFECHEYCKFDQRIIELME